MKKILSVLLALVLMTGLFTVAFAAEENDYSDYPVILVPGYTSAVLYRLDEETGEKITVWDDPVGQVSGNSDLMSLVPDFVTYLSEGNFKPLAARLGEGFNRIFDGMKCNPDGTSVYDVKVEIDTAEEGNLANLMEKYPEGDHQYEKEMITSIGEKIGFDKVYIFTCDWRMGAIESAEALRVYIDDVIRYENEKRAASGEGAIDRVNLFAVSHGGQISGAYLALYGEEGKINNAVLTCPALGGAGIAYDAFNCDVNFDDEGLVTFIQHGFAINEDFQILVAANRLGFLDEMVECLVPVCMETIGCWGSLWDFIPTDLYEDLKDRLLDEEVYAGLIEKSDRMHYDIMSPEGEHYYADAFEKVRALGTNIYIISGYDNQVVTGMTVSSDAILPTAGSTGAVVAPFGERFADGYTQKIDTGYYQVSPSMTVDASTAYLPDHTWFIENYFHGMTAKDPYSFSLMEKLLLNDESYDIRSFPEYPQFHATTNPSHSVFAFFDNSTEGYVSSEDTSLVVRNLSKDKSMVVSAIAVNGADIDFEFVPFTLAAGESKEVKIKGDIPTVSVKNFEINVTYLIETVTFFGSRTFDFTIMNGEKAEYDESKPFVKADMSQKIDAVLDKDTKVELQKYGVYGIVAAAFDIFYRLFDFLTGFIGFFTK